MAAIKTGRKAAAMAERKGALARIRAEDAKVLKQAKPNKPFEANANQRVLDDAAFANLIVPVDGRKTITQTIYVPAGTQEVVIRVVIGAPQQRMMRVVGSQGEITDVP